MARIKIYPKKSNIGIFNIDMDYEHKEGNFRVFSKNGKKILEIDESLISHIYYMQYNEVLGD